MIREGELKFNKKSSRKGYYKLTAAELRWKDKGTAATDLNSEWDGIIFMDSRLTVTLKGKADLELKMTQTQEASAAVPGKKPKKPKTKIESLVLRADGADSAKAWHAAFQAALTSHQ